MSSNNKLDYEEKEQVQSFQISEGDSLNNDVSTPTGVNTQESFIEPSLSDILASIKIDPTEELKPPEIAWQQVKACGDNITLGTLGDISTIIGKAKSRKSFLVNMITATVLTGGMFKGFKGCLPENKRRVLYFDTEQSSYYVHLLVKRICKQIDDANPSNLTVYPLRSFNSEERLNLIEHAIENTPNVGFVMIDGIRDLVTSINDEEQATKVTSKLLKWSEGYGTHIMCVLHQNKNDFNARGHLGTEMMNKSETILSVKKEVGNKSISKVEADYSRGIEPIPFAFHVIDNIPEIIEGYEVEIFSKKNIDLLKLTDMQKTAILDSVFKNDNQIRYKELVDYVQIATENIYLEKPGVNKVKDFIKQCRDSKLVFQEKEKAPYTRNKSNDLLF